MAAAQEMQTKANSQQEDALKNLSIQFSNRIGEKLDEADLFLKGAGRLELAEQKSGNFLLENDPIIMTPLYGEQFIGTSQDIYAVKRNHRLLLSLGDFALASGLGIKANADTGMASGWLRSQDQTFSLDALKKEVVINGSAQALDANDVAVQDGHILVSTDALEQWLGITFNYNFADLSLLITSKSPLPVELAFLRNQRKSNSISEGGRAKLPLMKNNYGLISLPYFDNNVSRFWRISPGAKTQINTDWSSVITGDFAGFNTRGFISGDDTAPYIDTARIKMGRDDADGNLLGPLHATSYEFGDVDTVSNALIGGGAQEQGVAVTNAPLDSTTTETYTQIRGNSQPGWDVELYRNEVFVDIRHVGSNGLYDFGNVDLNAGDNTFKLLFYGPQGEIREEHKTVTVSPYALSGKHGTYAVSASRQNITTFQKNKPTAPGTGDARISGRYDFGISGFGTGNIGVRYNSDRGTPRTLAKAGMATSAFDTFINADAAIDTSNKATAEIITARRNFGRQALFGQYLHNSKDFNASDPLGQSSTKDAYRLGLSGPLLNQFSIIERSNYNLNGGLSNFYDGATQYDFSAGVSGYIKPVNLSSNLRLTETKRPDGQTTKASTLLNTARGSLWGGIWRTDSLYELQPEHQLQQLSASYNRQILSNLESNTEVVYTPKPKTATLNVGLNWHTRYADILPSLQYDNDHNISLGLDVHFGMGANPYSYRYGVYNSYLSGAGGVAARIFMDKNGNGVFDNGDEPLQDAQLISMQTSQSAMSDKNGIAYIPDIERNHMTDIVANATSSADAYAYSMFEGASLRVHPGSVTKFEFPITEGGEMDGQADYIYNDNTRKSAAATELALIAPSGKIEKTGTVASDGYWSFSNIRPGVYYLVAQPDKILGGYLPPRLVEFKPDGTTLYGQKVELDGDGRPVKFTFRSTNKPPDGPIHARTIVRSDIKSQETLLSLGTFHSRIALNFSWYKFRLQNPGWAKLFDLVNPVSELIPDKKTQEMVIQMRPKKHLSPEQAGLACQDFKSINFDCAIEVITTYRDYVPVKGKPDNLIDKLIASVSPDKKTQLAQTSPAQPKVFAVTSQLQEAIAKTPEMPKTVRQYAAMNPTVNVKALRHQTVIINLGSFNSRELMALTWFKVKKKYGSMIGNATLLVQPSDSYASLETGKHSLLATSPGLDQAEAQRRCSLLAAQGQYCTIEIIPAPEQQGMTETENGAPPT